MDGTPNKTNIGANAILAVSMAVSKAGAAARGTHTRTEIESVPARERERAELKAGAVVYSFKQQ